MLLGTKLHVPGFNLGLVPRPRLAEQLDGSLGRGLILACAPAGYGKTALLADWARRGKRPITWLSLDIADNDPARFWRYVVAALDRACPGIGERIGPLLGPPAPPSLERLLEALINEMAVQLGSGEALLVLDDYHLISSETVHASLRFLLDQRPPGLRLILASRSDPPLSLARHRVSGQLAALLARLVAAQGVGHTAAARVPLGCLARLQRAFGVGHTRADDTKSAAVVFGLVEQLTRREREILGMLAAGKPNHAIATELVVTVDTVKKHVSHILDKLGG